MTFAEWFEGRWRREGETITDALERLSKATETSDLKRISYKSLFYVLKGCRCTPDTARRIEEISGGAVHARDLVMLPTRAEMGVGRTGTDG